LRRVFEGQMPQEEPIYTALMAAYAALRDMVTAEKLFDTMKQLEITPSVRTFEYVNSTAALMRGMVY
jgi:pentatricopeptide repeat protein